MRVILAVVVVLAVLWTATVCVAQPAKAPYPATKAVPASPAATGGAPANDMDGNAPSTWHDMIHVFGLLNMGLAALTFLGGLALFLGFEVRGKKWKEPLRVKIRNVHMTAGIVAITAGLVHYIGRCVQGGHAWFGLIPPTWAMIGFLVLLISGILRYKTPWKIMPWLHRAGFVVALYYVTMHAQYQYHKFLKTGR